MTVRNSSQAFALLPSTLEVFERLIPKTSPFDEVARDIKGIFNRLSHPWPRARLSPFDDFLLADVDVAKKAVRTANVIAPFKRSLSPYEVEEIARAVADKMGRRRRRRSNAVIDVEEVRCVARAADALPALRSPKKRGRKAKYRLLEQEMQRRAGAGTMRRTWQEEIKALRAWMKRLPTDQRPAPKTIYNRHRELQAMYDSLISGGNVPIL
jgi:hypothetical protein